MSIFNNLYKAWIKHSLVRQQKKNIASLEILENYLTTVILEGNEGRRNQLVDIQQKLGEAQRFLKFLTK